MKQMFSNEEVKAISKEVADAEFDENLKANPELEGDEETLSSIGIKGTNYAVGGGSEVHLYKHVIALQGGNQFEIYNASSVPLTISTLKQEYQGVLLGYRKFVAQEGSQLEIPYRVEATITESAVKTTYYALKVTGTTLDSNYSFTNNSVGSLVDTITQIF